MPIDLQLHADFLGRLVADALREQLAPPPLLVNAGEVRALDRFDAMVGGTPGAPAWCSRFRRVPGAPDGTRVQLFQRVRIRFAAVGKLAEAPVAASLTTWVDVFVPLELGVQRASATKLRFTARVAAVEVPGPGGPTTKRILTGDDVTAILGLTATALGDVDAGWGALAGVLVGQVAARGEKLLGDLTISRDLALDPNTFLAPLTPPGTARAQLASVHVAPDREGRSMILRLGVAPDPCGAPPVDGVAFAAAAHAPLPGDAKWSVSLDGCLISKMVQSRVAASIAASARTTQRTPVSVSLANIDGPSQPYWTAAVGQQPALGTPGPMGAQRRGVGIHVEVGVVARTLQEWCEIDVDVTSDTHLFGGGRGLVSIEREVRDESEWDMFGCVLTSVFGGAIIGMLAGGPVGAIVGAVVGLVNAIVMFAMEASDRSSPPGPPSPLPDGWNLSFAAQALPYGMTIDDVQWDATGDRLVLGGAAQLAAAPVRIGVTVETSRWTPRNMCNPATEIWAGHVVSVSSNVAVAVSALWLLDGDAAVTAERVPAAGTDAPLLADEQAAPAYKLRNLSAPRAYAGPDALAVELAGTDPLRGYHAVNGYVFTSAGTLRVTAPAVEPMSPAALADLRAMLSSEQQRRTCEKIHQRLTPNGRKVKTPVSDPGWKGPLLWRIAVRGEGPWVRKHLAAVGDQRFELVDHMMLLTRGGAEIALQGAKQGDRVPVDVLVGRLTPREQLVFEAPVTRMALSRRGARLDVESGGETHRFSLHGPRALRTLVTSSDALRIPGDALGDHAPAGALDGRALAWGRDVVGFRSVAAVRSSDNVVDVYAMEEVEPAQLAWSD